MCLSGEIKRRIQALFQSRSASKRELDEEMELHLDPRSSSGRTPDFRRGTLGAARDKPLEIQPHSGEEPYGSWGSEGLESLWQDISHGTLLHAALARAHGSGLLSPVSASEPTPRSSAS